MTRFTLRERSSFANVDRACSGMRPGTRRRLAYINSDQTKTSGADFETSCAAPMSRFVDSWNGNLSLLLLAMYVRDLTTTDGSSSENLAGINRMAPWHRLHRPISGVDSCQPECPDPQYS